MSTAAKQLKINIVDYLTGELVSEMKHEYINGHVYAMAGAKRAHNIISMNLSATIHQHLKTTPCRVFGPDMKIGILTDTDDYFYYPDLHVSCETTGHTHYNCQPKLIIEVLSNSTERKDRAEKFHNYRKLASLEEYILVAQDCQRIEIYSRSKIWDLALYIDESDFNIHSIGLNLTVAEIYQNVAFEH